MPIDAVAAGPTLARAEGACRIPETIALAQPNAADMRLVFRTSVGDALRLFLFGGVLVQGRRETNATRVGVGLRASSHKSKILQTHRTVRVP